MAQLQQFIKRYNFFKLGQNRSKEDRQGLIEGLLKQNDNEAKQLAELMQNYYSAP